MLRFLVLSSLLVTSIYSTEVQADCDISGIWRHSTKPAKLLVDLRKGEISVQSHDNNAKAVGLVVLKDLKSSLTSANWDAKMYSAAEDSFVDVQITSESCNHLSVNYNSEEILELFR
ncbi:hypothetical protein [Pseudoalteromonas sp. L1]|uniref:hypothetical protein n=1 Tax=unclassified Pseudoalteromonas TaxID=194690 RepID=UPI001F242AC7|nr:hypothetical protein [Pseudoalteromonas sp. L1]